MRCPFSCSRVARQGHESLITMRPLVQVQPGPPHHADLEKRSSVVSLDRGRSSESPARSGQNASLRGWLDLLPTWWSGRRIDRPWGGRGQPTPEVICVAVRLPGLCSPARQRPRPGPFFYVDTLGLTPVVEGDGVLAFRCAEGTDFGVFVSQGRSSGTHTQVTVFCRNLDAEVADLRARGVQLEEFDMPRVTVKDGVYDMNGQWGAWFRDPEGNLLAVAERPDDSVS